MNIVACRRCGRGVTHTVTTHGKAMAVDHRPTPNGSFRLQFTPDEPVPIAIFVAPFHRTAEFDLFDSHLSTCPIPPKKKRRLS